MGPAARTNGILALVTCYLVGASARSLTVKRDVPMVGSEDKPPEPPVFSEVFYATYNFSMPHLYLTQPDGLNYEVSVWYDGPNQRRRVESYGGEDTCVTVGGVDYTLIPRIDRLHCDVWGSPGREIFSPLPDMWAWEYGGLVEVKGRQAYIWLRSFNEHGKLSQYTFYVTPDNEPLRLVMIGTNYISGSHADEYIYDFTHFEPSLPTGKEARKLFEVPNLCIAASSGAEGAGAAQTDSATSAADVGRPHPRAMQMGAALPQIQAYDHSHAYAAFSRATGRLHDGHAEYDARMRRFREVAAMVQAHNANPASSSRLRVNAWADWHREEWTATMLPNKRLAPALLPEQATGEAGKDVLLSELGGSYTPKGRFRATMTKDQLPTAVDWRGTGADPGIKDQAMCGSCYAFAATGAMDGAWFVATGQRRSFSEQQIVDCAEDFGPNGCFGGYYQPVFNYVAESGGIAEEHSYSYRGEVGFCRVANHSLVGRFDGYLAVESRDDVALMEAVYKYGPVAVSVDADPETFSFYSEGVLDEPACSSKMRDLDHTVTLYGYGTTPEGKDYWLVRNSWSRYWGADGYLRIARGKRDCGIATDAAVPRVAKEAEVPGARERAMAAAARWD
ncbi:hypothetical protein HYH03_005213 [Edaphochlamys debaryana]|uniref:Uncharacterized protein n=1 Tax=Edaphochlamys debaryana TaxID=47281 RepID=A0A835Y9Q9_9CHLO|nr:hypothetical protein HYH03_005213 [Edaphochlamys debaryana]|eukprot:KAG2496806.1 hypothetical protein HYH03_005213 [Edaphochlamys debaryana]